jgi:glucokinase
MKDKTIRHAVGIDFGGTSVKMGLVSEKGEIKAKRKFVTSEASSQEAWLDAVEKNIEALFKEVPAAESSFIGIGVGVPGFVDYDRGFIYDLTNVPGWTAVHLVEMLEKRFKKIARVDNDVNAMALGECTFGVGRAYQHAVFVTLGTGVGGGILINNNLYRGAYSMAGEIGHVSIDMNGVKSPQGKGGLEQYIGNRRIVERAVRLMDEGRKSIIKDLAKQSSDGITPKLIEQAARKGDELALEIFDYVADCLATVFASVTYLIQPQAFIVGGGVAQAGKFLFDPLDKHLKDRLSPYFAEHVVVKTAELGNDAGMIGSATLVFMA